MPIFAEAATALIDQKRAGWKNPVQARDWRNSLRSYGFLGIDRQSVFKVTSADLQAIPELRWHNRFVAADGLRGRLRTEPGAVAVWADPSCSRKAKPSGSRRTRRCQ